jgi:tetratricopeptide (TPR) repeat protein
MTENVVQEALFHVERGLRNSGRCDRAQREQLTFTLISESLAASRDLPCRGAASLVALAAESAPTCYPSSMMSAEVALRAGLRVALLSGPGHVLVAGEHYAFESTAKPPRVPVTPKDEYLRGHRGFREIPLEKAFSVTYLNSSAIVSKSDAKAALLLSEKGLALDPDDPMSHFNKAIILGKLKRVDEALASIERAMELDPRNMTFLFEKGLSLRDKGDYDGSLRCLNRAFRRTNLEDDLMLTFHIWEARKEVKSRMRESCGKGAVGFMRYAVRCARLI